MHRKTIDKIIAILVGVIVWSYVIGVKDPVVTGMVKSVPVQLTNMNVMESKGLAIAGTGEYTVDLVVGGNRTVVNNAVPEDFIAKADVSELALGQNYITVEVESPSNLSVNEIRTQRIQVYVDTAVAKEKDIKLVSENVPTGSEIGAIKTDINHITVTGAQSLVDKVDAIKVQLDAKSMEKDTEGEQKISLIPVDADGNEVIGVNLSQPELNVKTTLYDTKELAINIPIEGELNEHISLRSEIVPASVVVKGPKDILADLWQVNAEPIDRSSVTESCKIPVSVILPDKVELTDSYKNIAVEYEVKGRVEKEFTINEASLQFENIPEGFTVKLDEPFAIRLSIYEDEVEFISSELIRVSVDLAGLGEGQIKLPISNIDISAIDAAILLEQPENICVSLSAKDSLTETAVESVLD